MADDFVAAAAAMRAHKREREWRCFQCDEVFTDESEALTHFGKVATYMPPLCCDRTLATYLDAVRKLREEEVQSLELFRQKTKLEHDSNELRKLLRALKWHVWPWTWQVPSTLRETIENEIRAINGP